MAGKKSYIYNESNQLIYPKTVASAIDSLDTKIDERIGNMHFVTNSALISTLTTYFPAESGGSLITAVGELTTSVASCASSIASILANDYLTTSALSVSLEDLSANLTREYTDYADRKTTSVISTFTNYYTKSEINTITTSIVTGAASIDLSAYATISYVSNEVGTRPTYDYLDTVTVSFGEQVESLTTSIGNCVTTSGLTNTLSAYYTTSQVNDNFVAKDDLSDTLINYVINEDLPTYATCTDVYDLYIDADNGSDTDGNGSSGAPYATLMKAIDRMVALHAKNVTFNLASSAGAYPLEFESQYTGVDWVFKGSASQRVNLYNSSGGDTCYFVNSNVSFEDIYLFTSIGGAPNHILTGINSSLTFTSCKCELPISITDGHLTFVDGQIRQITTTNSDVYIEGENIIFLPDSSMLYALSFNNSRVRFNRSTALTNHVNKYTQGMLINDSIVTVSSVVLDSFSQIVSNASYKYIKSGINLLITQDKTL